MIDDDDDDYDDDQNMGNITHLDDDRYRPAKAKRRYHPPLVVNGQSFDYADLAYMRPADKAEILEVLRRE